MNPPSLHAVQNLKPIMNSHSPLVSVSDNFMDLYLDYTSETEVPTFFSRWAALVGLGAYLGRGLNFNHGHFSIQPNIYCMLIGQPATRKSTAIKLMKSLLLKAGYTTVAADKTTKEKFLLDLAGDTSSEGEQGDKSNRVEVNIDSMNLFGESYDTSDKEMLIAADEFNDFFGNGNIEFASLLGTLWDYNGTYRYRIKNGKSVNVSNPTVSMLGGNTPTGFSLAFPAEILGQGFFSRMLLVYGEPTGKKITFPKAPPEELTAELISYLQTIKMKCRGELQVPHSSELLLDKIYKSWGGLDDVRFETYSNRRFTHLLKMCLVVCASYCTKILTEDKIILANTILSHTEHMMPKALGEFGKARHADTVHKIIQILDRELKPVSVADLWKHVVQDLEKITDLADLMRNLVAADKVSVYDGKFLIKRKILKETINDVVDYSLLRDEEVGR